MKRALPAIPTTYRGVRLRSRLEARWAAFFDALGWEWHYEPVDLNGYIPDFLITSWRPCVGAQSGLDTSEPLAVECKPFVQLDQDAAAVAAKIDNGGWLGDALILGSVHWPERKRVLAPTLSGDAFEPVVERGPVVHTYTIGRMRRAIAEGGRATWTDAYLVRDACDWYPSPMRRELTPSEYMFVTMAWAEAGNKTQWKADRR